MSIESSRISNRALILALIYNPNLSNYEDPSQFYESAVHSFGFVPHRQMAFKLHSLIFPSTHVVFSKMHMASLMIVQNFVCISGTEFMVQW